MRNAGLGITTAGDRSEALAAVQANPAGALPIDLGTLHMPASTSRATCASMPGPTTWPW